MLGVFKLAAEMAGIPATLLLSICSAESDLRADVVNFQDGGGDSIGICQTKESTARMLGFSGDPNLLLNRWYSAQYAAKYLRRQLRRYKGDVCSAVAAYNRGTVKRLPDGRFSNQKYVDRVMGRWMKYAPEEAQGWVDRCSRKDKDVASRVQG